MLFQSSLETLRAWNWPRFEPVSKLKVQNIGIPSHPLLQRGWSNYRSPPVTEQLPLFRLCWGFLLLRRTSLWQRTCLPLWHPHNSRPRLLNEQVPNAKLLPRPKKKKSTWSPAKKRHAQRKSTARNNKSNKAPARGVQCLIWSADRKTLFLSFATTSPLKFQPLFPLFWCRDSPDSLALEKIVLAVSIWLFYCF